MSFKSPLGRPSRWNEQLDTALRELKAAGRGPAEISRILGFGKTSIKARLRHLGVYKCPSDDGKRDRFSRNAILLQDECFRIAMHKAIAAGLEHCQIGVVKDESPISRTHFWPALIHSATGSPAQTCSDIGSNDHSSWSAGTDGRQRSSHQGRPKPWKPAIVGFAS
jgi:hypothetical protein